MAMRKGEARINRLAAAILRSGGVVTFPVAMAMLHEDKQTTSRTLDWLVKAGSLRRIQIPGGSNVWMSERSLVRSFNSGESPAVYKLSRTARWWVPGPTFRHDQLALRVLFSLAEPEDVLTEHEIRRSGTWRGRVPDGVVRLMLPGLARPVAAVLEIETSRKTGSVCKAQGEVGGWARLAIHLHRVAHDLLGSRQQTVLGTTETTLVVASPSHLGSIAKKVEEVAQQHPDQDGVTSTLWYAAELYPDGDIGVVMLMLTGEHEGPGPEYVEDDTFCA